MKFSLIVCTYLRPKPLLKLLNSVKTQSLYPDEILIVDGSTNNLTKEILDNNPFVNLKYFKVDDANRGLTKQRNYGINKVETNIDIVCFLDDDIVLEPDYFKNLIETYNNYPDALGIGGYIKNAVKWNKGTIKSSKVFNYDGWNRKEPFRFRARRVFGLEPNTQPGFLPDFSHGRSIGFLPPSGKIYEVEQLMGGVASYKKSVFNNFSFSSYFDGYGLYEDADFTLRLSKTGSLYVNTKAQLNHYHEESGRPNKFKYGKMVTRNGWYVWRVRYPKPSLKAKLKWNFTSFLLTLIRFSNIFNTKNRTEAFTESLGRMYGWLTLIFNKPKVER